MFWAGKVKQLQTWGYPCLQTNENKLPIWRGHVPAISYQHPWKHPAEGKMLSNCGAGKDSWESPGLQGDPTCQFFLKELNPEYAWEGLMLKLQYFGHLMWRADSLEKTLMLWKIEGERKTGWQRMRWLERITNSMDVNLSKLQETGEDREPGMLQPMRSHTT